MNFFQEKFDVEKDQKDNILSLAGDKYRSYRSKMKATFHEPRATNEEWLRHKPPLVYDVDWRWLVQFWSSEEAQVRFNITFFLMIIHLLLFTLHLYFFLIHVISKRNKENRAK